VLIFIVFRNPFFRKVCMCNKCIAMSADWQLLVPGRCH